MKSISEIFFQFDFRLRFRRNVRPRREGNKGSHLFIFLAVWCDGIYWMSNKIGVPPFYYWITITNFIPIYADSQGFGFTLARGAFGSPSRIFSRLSQMQRVFCNCVIGDRPRLFYLYPRVAAKRRGRCKSPLDDLL